MSDRQHELYQQVILDHNKKPRNYGDLEGATHEAEGYNPLCGDHLTIKLIVGDSGQIRDIRFQGEGCAISRASASMLTSNLKGKSVGEAAVVIDEFKRMVKGELNPDTDEHHLGRLKIFSGIWRYPSRVKCANLAWHATSGALENKATVSTEKEDES